MSTYMWGGGTNFRIKKENFQYVIDQIDLWNSTYLGEDEWAWRRKTPPVNIQDAFDCVGWWPAVDANGNVCGLSFNDGGCEDDDEDLFDAIAPYVEAGSTLEMRNEDGCFWTWYFDGKTCTKYDAVIRYPGLPDHSRTFTDERDPETLIPISQLKREYAQHILDDSIDPAEVTFTQYLSNCMSDQGGTLTEVK